VPLKPPREEKKAMVPGAPLFEGGVGGSAGSEAPAEASWAEQFLRPRKKRWQTGDRGKKGTDRPRKDSEKAVLGIAKNDEREGTKTYVKVKRTAPRKKKEVHPGKSKRDSSNEGYGPHHRGAHHLIPGGRLSSQKGVEGQKGEKARLLREERSSFRK